MARAPTPMMDDQAPGAVGEEDSSRTVCSIVTAPGGGYVVYAGDEPEPETGEGTPTEEGGEMGEEAAPEGTPAQSIGEALNAVHDILQRDQDQGGTEQEAFNQAIGGRETMPPAQGAM